MHIGHDVVQWVATGFLAATTATMLADRMGAAAIRRAHDVYRDAGACSPPARCSARFAWNADADRRAGDAGRCRRHVAAARDGRTVPRVPARRARPRDGHVRLRHRARAGNRPDDRRRAAGGFRLAHRSSCCRCRSAIAAVAHRARGRWLTTRTAGGQPFDVAGALLLVAALRGAAQGAGASATVSGWASAVSRSRLALAGGALAVVVRRRGSGVRRTRRYCASRLFRHRASPGLRSSRSPTATASSAPRTWCRCSSRRSRITARATPAACCSRRASRWRTPSRSAAG